MNYLDKIRTAEQDEPDTAAVEVEIQKKM
jgi:hypothetical protein